MQMVKTKSYDYKNEVIDFGFVYKGASENGKTIKEILNSTNQNCIIFDTKNIIFTKIITQLSEVFKDTSKILIGLADKRTFENIAKSGLKDGFFRSTNEQSYGAIIIIDQKKMYYAIDENTVFECSDDSVDEVFMYINFLLWNKSEHELLQGSINDVKEIRQSVVRPNFKKVVHKSQIETEGYILASTNDFIGNISNNLIYSEDIIPNSTIVKKSIHSIAVKSDKCYIPFVEDLYLKANYNSNIELAHSFTNQTLSSLISKKIWINNQIFTVLKENVINVEERISLDQADSYLPDFDKYLDTNSKDKYLKTIININVLPMTLDNTYQKSPRYQKRIQMMNNIDNNIRSLIKLKDDKEIKDIHTLNKILEETRISEKAKVYNDYVDKHESGLKALNNKKNSFSNKFLINEKDFTVPSDTTGVLYEKKNHLYLAVENESKLDSAVKFFKDNNLTGSVILDE